MFWEQKTLESEFTIKPARYEFSPVARLKNGYSVPNIGRTQAEFVVKYFGCECNLEFLQLLERHMEEQHAVQADGLVYLDFRVWFEPYNVALTKLQRYRARMAQVDQILQGEGFELESQSEFVCKEFAVFLNPKTERVIGTPHQVASAILACKLVKLYFPESLQHNDLVFAVCWNSVQKGATPIVSTRQARKQVLQTLNAIPVVEKGLRVVGSQIAQFLDLASLRRVAKAFSGMYEIVFAFSMRAVEAELMNKLGLESKPALLERLDLCGMSPQLLTLLLNRAAECPERLLTIGTEAIKKEIQARMELSPQDHLVIEYCCTMLGGPEFREKKFIALHRMEPELVQAYVENGFVGTANELVACLHLKQILRRLLPTANEVDLEFAGLRREMLKSAKTSNKSWETIGKEAIKRYMNDKRTKSLW
ncbi:hypothetical protein BASA81_006158 [Batrachochytrium salamandrivorans]|nr:hypothetical protein BASA81_006158 [Batrachochytrium salamandrivorans]